MGCRATGNEQHRNKLCTSLFSAAYIDQDLLVLLLWILFNTVITASYASNYTFVLPKHNALGVTSVGYIVRTIRKLTELVYCTRPSIS